jgi:hypothetical protein
MLELAINQIGFLSAGGKAVAGGLEINVSKDIFQIMETPFAEDGHDRTSSIRIKRKH